VRIAAHALAAPFAAPLALALAGCAAAVPLESPPSVYEAARSGHPRVEQLHAPTACADCGERDVAPGLRSEPRARPELASRRFRVADLPAGTRPPELSRDVAPVELAPGPEPPELVVDRGTDTCDVHVDAPARSVAWVSIDRTEASSGKGLRVDRQDSVVPARWKILTRLDGDAGSYTFVDAWFDSNACRASVVRRTTLAVAALPSRLMYGLRERAPGGGETETVVLVGPSLADVSVIAAGRLAPARDGGAASVVELPVRKGTGSSFSAALPRQAWSGLVPRDAGLPPYTVGADIAQSVTEDEPVAVFHVGK
jgi:hypothetical protein